MAFEAVYTGSECHACQEIIQEGQMIEQHPVHAGPVRTWRHVQPCPEPLAEKPTKFVGTDDESMGF